MDQHQAGIKHSVQSKVDDQHQSLFSALKPRDNQSVKSDHQPHGHAVQSVSQHSVEAQHDLLTLLTTNQHDYFEDKEHIVNGDSIVKQDEEEEEVTEKRVDEDKEDNHQRVKVKTVNESETDSKSNFPKEQLPETIGEEYYLYDDH